MDTIIRGVTLETVKQAIQSKAGIKPGESFSIVVVDAAEPRPHLADIAARIRSTAAAKGLTEEIFERVMSRP